MPIADLVLLSAKLIKSMRLEGYKGAPRGMSSTPKDRVNVHLLAVFGG